METFPTLTGKWIIAGAQDSWAVNPVRQSPAGLGAQQRFNAATFAPKSFTRTIRVMPASDVTSIKTLLSNTNDGQYPFSWLDPISANYYYVFIAMTSMPVRFDTDQRNDLFKTTITFEQYDSTEISDGEFGYGAFGAGKFGE